MTFQLAPHLTLAQRIEPVRLQTYEVYMPGGRILKIRSLAQRDWANALCVDMDGQAYCLGVYDSGAEPPALRGHGYFVRPAERIDDE